MSSDGIINEVEKSQEKKNEQNNNNNIFSEDLNSSPSSENHIKRNSLRVLTLNDILKEDFEIFDKKEEDYHLTNNRKTKYKSIQLTSNDLNFLMCQSTKNSLSKNKLNEKLESIKETSVDNVKENDINNNNTNERLNLSIDNNIILNTEPSKIQINNIKKVMKTSGSKNLTNSNGNFKNKNSTGNIKINLNNEKGSKNDISDFNINNEIEKNNVKNKNKSESDSDKLLKINLSNNFKVLDKANSLKSGNSIQLKKDSKQVSKEINSIIENVKKIEKDESYKDSTISNKIEKGKKTHYKSSSISITYDRSIMNSIKSKITDSITSINCKNNVKLSNKNSSMIKDSDKRSNFDDIEKNKNKIKINKDTNTSINKTITVINKNSTNISNNNIGIEKKNNINLTSQTPVSKKSSILSYSKQYEEQSKIKQIKNTTIKDKDKENLSGRSTIMKVSTDISTKMPNNIKNQNQFIKISQYNTSITKKCEKTNIKSDLKKTSKFSLSEQSSTLSKAKSKNNYSTVSTENPSSSLIKFKTSSNFNKASSMPKKLSPLLEIKESKNEFATSAGAKQAKNTNVNVDEFYSREMEYLERRKKKLELMAENSLKKELENVLEFPSICKTSRKIVEKNTNDFYTRQTTFSNRIKSKIKEKIEEQNKKETEMIDKFQQKYKGKKIDINRKYEDLLNWQKQKTEGLKEKQKNEYETQIKTCTFKPEIDQNSKKIAIIKRAYDSNTGANSQDMVSRLYKDETLKRRHKNEILKNIYTPTFSPMVNTKISYGNSHNYNYNYTLTHQNNHLNNSFNNNNLNNTTCNTITGLQTGKGNPHDANVSGVKSHDKYKNQFLYGTFNSTFSNNNRNKNFNIINSNFNENASLNMRKFKSQNKNMNSRENSARSRNHNNNDFRSNKDENDNRINSSFHSEGNGDGKGYYKSFFTGAVENPRELGNLLKEKFQNVFKKYNVN